MNDMQTQPSADLLLRAMERTGWVRLRAALDSTAAAEACAALWCALAERSGIDSQRPATWPSGGVGGFQKLARTGVFDRMRAPIVDAACDALLGAGCWRSQPHGVVPLVTFPQAGPWHLPRTAWHLDFAPRAVAGKLPGLRLFAFVAPVEPHGGGTVLMEGSHRLVERLVEQDRAGQHSADLRRRLQRAYPWFAAFWSETTAPEVRTALLGREENVDGVAVRPIELTGAAGDVVIMHPWLLHAAAPNCRTSPRLMLSWSVFTAAASRESHDRRNTTGHRCDM